MEIEQKLNKVRKIRRGPRIIDILIYNKYFLNKDKLTILHPRMMERTFVVVPLFEIATEISIEGRNLKNILRKLNSEKIRKINYE